MSSDVVSIVKIIEKWCTIGKDVANKNLYFYVPYTAMCKKGSRQFKLWVTDDKFEFLADDFKKLEKIRKKAKTFTRKNKSSLLFQGKFRFYTAVIQLRH